MNRGRSLIRHRIFLDFSCFRIEPADLVRVSVVRHPVIAVFVGECAPRHAARSRQFIFDVDDFHRVVVKSPHQLLVLRHLRGGFRQNGGVAKKRVEIGSNVFRILVVEWTAYSTEEKVHGLLHVIDAVAPPVFIAPHRCHARLKSVARKTSSDQQFLALRVGEENFALILGQIAPADHSLLQREIAGRVLIRRQAHTSARIRAIPGRFHLHLIFSTLANSQCGSGRPCPSTRSPARASRYFAPAQMRRGTRCRPALSPSRSQSRHWNSQQEIRMSPAQKQSWKRISWLLLRRKSPIAKECSRILLQF